MTVAGRAVRRVLIAAHYASERLGGEAAIPLRLFTRLRERGVDVWLVTHDSGRDELDGLLADARDHVVYTPSLPGMTPVFTRGERLGDGLRALAWAVTQVERQAAMIPAIRRLVAEHDIQLVHAPVGVAPSLPSPLRRLGAPVVFGPLNGGMSLPPAMRAREEIGRRLTQRARGLATRTGHRAMRGRLDAALVLVANERTRQLLPAGTPHLGLPARSEIGVDLASWAPRSHDQARDGVRLVFAGRLVALKGVDLLLEALVGATETVTLDVIGDGPAAAELRTLAGRLGLTERVRFLGWLDQAGLAETMGAADGFVFPSLREAGGTAVLEAMAAGLPVVVADWGGPAEMVDDSVGIKVPVDGRDTFVAGVRAAIDRLAVDADLRRRLGAAGRERVASTYDWSVLVDRLLDAYEAVLAGPSPLPTRTG
jgi:glycosyltransferase involved in cell wall biosynthesis